MGKQVKVERKHPRSLAKKSKAVKVSRKNLNNAQIQALLNMPLQALLQGGYRLSQTRRKIEGMENAEDEADVVRRSYIPACIAECMTEYQEEALSRYKELKDSRIKLSGMSFEQTGGGAADDDVEPVKEKDSKAYWNLRDQFTACYRRREGERAVGELEMLLNVPHKAVLDTDQRINIGLYANRLAVLLGIQGRNDDIF